MKSLILAFIALVVSLPVAEAATKKVSKACPRGLGAVGKGTFKNQFEFSGSSGRKSTTRSQPEEFAESDEVLTANDTNGDHAGGDGGDDAMIR